MSKNETWKDRLFRNAFCRLFVFTILFEDTEIEERFFEVDERSRILSVSAAGCGIASHLARHPERIDAVDTNAHHLALTALKVSAAQSLGSFQDLYDLFGHGRHADARKVVGGLTASLPEWIQKYWSERYRIFESGLYRHGLFSRLICRLHSEAGITEPWLREVMNLSVEKRVEESMAKYRKALARPHIAAAVRSPLILLAQGINFRQRDRNLRNNEATSMKGALLSLVERMARTDVERNWIVWHCQLGQFNHRNPDAVPPYLRESSHRRSYRAPTRTHYHRRSFIDVLAEAPPENWSHYSFSDAMDWLPETTQRKVLSEVLRTSRRDAILINRTVEKRCPIEELGLQRHFRRIDTASDEATRQERSRLYHRVDLYRVAR